MRGCGERRGRVAIIGSLETPNVTIKTLCFNSGKDTKASGSDRR